MQLLGSMINREMSYQPGDEVQTFQNKKLVIFKPGKTLKKEAIFSAYHLILPKEPLPSIQIDNKKYSFEKNKILVINPYQKMKVELEANPVDYYAIFIVRDTVEEIGKEIFNKSKVHFNNYNFQINKYFKNLLRRFTFESINKQKGFEFVLDCISSEMVAFLLRNIKSNVKSNINTKNYSEKKNINRAIEYINSYYNQGFNLEELASVANLSPYYFIRIFKTETGKTPFEHLISIRIEKAKELLKLKDFKIIEIAYICGFSSPGHFSTTFKNKVGIPPSTYRKNI